jgi:hypothetical protein
MQQTAKLLIFIGLLFVFIGALLLVIPKLGIQLGHLPGDITFHRKNMTIFAPLGTMFVISIALSVIINILSRWKH